MDLRLMVYFSMSQIGMKKKVSRDAVKEEDRVIKQEAAPVAHVSDK
ncbi:MAG: hypothetical protein UY04_C0037G0002 [Parcubacteria group bacterium GW2011_GWA2_47_7]|nr:MAG: hypothetical protein UY04_C0037G0002 [Parcubacteria group bacterium GW2011_GWA2_47_7]